MGYTTDTHYASLQLEHERWDAKYGSKVEPIILENQAVDVSAFGGGIMTLSVEIRLVNGERKSKSGQVEIPFRSAAQTAKQREDGTWEMVWCFGYFPRTYSEMQEIMVGGEIYQFPVTDIYNDPQPIYTGKVQIGEQVFPVRRDMRKSPYWFLDESK